MRKVKRTQILAAALVYASVVSGQETTPLSLPGSEPIVFRKIGDTELRLHVVKPSGWAASDQRACMVCYFGGGWSSGTPERSIGWAKWAADHGMVGIAPDYRTRKRFDSVPEDCVADARVAVRWIEEHAAELGIDPNKIVVQGSSAGGHVAAWTAIAKPGPGADDPAPAILPAAMVLLNPVTDTTESGYGGPSRFSGDVARALACSVPHQMQADMPPAIVFHATADATVPYANSVDFKDRMAENGNRCELVTFEGLGHAYYASSKYGDPAREAGKKTYEDVEVFLESLNLISSQ